MPVPNPDYNPNWENVLLRHRAEFERLMQESNKLTLFQGGVENPEIRQKLLDLHEATVEQINAMQRAHDSQFRTIEDYDRYHEQLRKQKEAAALLSDYREQARRTPNPESAVPKQTTAENMETAYQDSVLKEIKGPSAAPPKPNLDQAAKTIPQTRAHWERGNAPYPLYLSDRPSELSAEFAKQSLGGKAAAGMNMGMAGLMIYNSIHAIASNEPKSGLKKGAITVDLLNATTMIAGEGSALFANGGRAAEALRFLRGTGGTVLGVGLGVASTGLVVADDLKRGDTKAAKRDGAVGIAGIAGGVGGGAFVGMMGGGPVGAFFGGMAGGFGAATGTNALMDMMREDPRRAMQMVGWQGDYMRGLMSGDEKKAEQAKFKYLEQVTGRKVSAGIEAGIGMIKDLLFKNPLVEGAERMFAEAKLRGFKPPSTEEMLSHVGDSYKAYKTLIKSGEFGNALGVYGEYTGHLLEIASRGLSSYDARHLENLHAQATKDLADAFPGEYKSLMANLSAQPQPQPGNNAPAHAPPKVN